MNENFFQVVELETQKTETFTSARDVSFYLSGCSYAFFKVLKNGKEVLLNGVTSRALKNVLQTA